jgi:hypothetical protein
MAIEPFPLLQRLKVGAYDNCVILTYTADLYFYEQVVLPTLRSRGCCNNVVIMDGRQHTSAIDAAGTLLHRLGKSYSVWPVLAAKAFHPKIIFQTNAQRGRLIIGSGNLTVRGFSTNWEVFSELTFTSESESITALTEAWTLITESAQGATKAVRRQIDQVRRTSGALLEIEQEANWPRLLSATPSQTPLLDQLKSVVGRGKVRRVIVVAPFFDSGLRAVKELRRAFGVKDVVVIVQQDSVSFPGKASRNMKNLAVHEFRPPSGGTSRYLHAKVYIIQTASTEYCVWGSANCSMAALGGKGNYEAVLVKKGKVGDGVSALGLGDSLRKSQRIDPFQLKLASQESTEPAFSLISAEVEGGNVSVLIGPISRFAECDHGRLKLTSGGVELGEVKVERTSVSSFTGKLRHDTNGGCVICRLVLKDKAGEQESTPVAIHFLRDLEEATPTRFQSHLRGMIDAIRGGTFDWADGLENVCKLVIKIGTEGARSKDVVRRNKKLDKPAVDQEKTTEGEYEDFISDTAEEMREAEEARTSSLLEAVVATLRAQIRDGITKEDEDDHFAEHEAWRYQEEVERESAELGVSEPEQGQQDSESLDRKHVRVGRIYVRLIRDLARRYEWLHNNRDLMGREEFWRLDAVNLLLLDGCGRHLDAAHHLGPVLSPEDVAREYFPVLVPVLEGVRSLQRTKEKVGGLLDWTQDGPVDLGIASGLQTTCALLTGVVAHQRCKTESVADEEAFDEWSHYAELFAARCLAAMLRKGLLPGQEDIAESIGRSAWLTSIGGDKLNEVFDDLCRLGRSIVRCEDRFSVEKPPRALQEFSPGDWVFEAVCGVTEVASAAGSKVEIATFGVPNTSDVGYREVNARDLRRTNIPTKVRLRPADVSEELDHLLSYSDEDFEEWRELIMPQVEHGYLISLERVAHRAKSLQLRNEASKQIAQNALRAGTARKR